MLVRIITITTFLFISTQPCFANSLDKLHIAGNYLCTGYDMHDGPYKGARLVLTLDSKNSDFQNNYGAYLFKLTEPDGTQYTGEVAASGNALAVYFENTSASMPTDRGVGIASLVHDKGADGKIITSFHKFYYEPTYEKGGNGYENCVKQN